MGCHHQGSHTGSTLGYAVTSQTKLTVRRCMSVHLETHLPLKLSSTHLTCFQLNQLQKLLIVHHVNLIPYTLSSIRTWSGKLQTTRIWTTFGMTHTSLTLFMKQTSFGTPTLGGCSLCRSKVLFKTSSLVVLNLQSITLCGSGLLGQENVLASLSHWSIWRRDHQNSSIHLACSSAVNTATFKELYRLGLLVGWLMRNYKTVHTRRQTDRQAGRQAGRQTNRQTHVQADRHAETGRQEDSSQAVRRSRTCLLWSCSSHNLRVQGSPRGSSACRTPSTCVGLLQSKSWTVFIMQQPTVGDACLVSRTQCGRRW